MDLNSDGHLDYLTATFDGSPHVAYGSEEGFAAPVHLLDAQGERIIISSYWEPAAREHTVSQRSMPAGSTVQERCISSLAFDWDADGDYDLLLGSYGNGSLYRQMNEGTNEAPKFSGKNIPVLAGSNPWKLSSKMTGLQLVDWDRDGDLDLIAGTFGSVYSRLRVGGGVYLARNEGKPGAPRFARLKALIPPSYTDATAPSGPFGGLYPAVIDADGDGDLDLVVGGYDIWTPARRELSETERVELRKIRVALKAQQNRNQEVGNKRRAAAAAARDAKHPDEAARQAAIRKAKAPYEADMQDSSDRIKALSDRMERYVPSQRRVSGVWLFERL